MTWAELMFHTHVGKCLKALRLVAWWSIWTFSRLLLYIFHSWLCALQVSCLPSMQCIAVRGLYMEAPHVYTQVRG